MVCVGGQKMSDIEFEPFQCKNSVLILIFLPLKSEHFRIVSRYMANFSFGNVKKIREPRQNSPTVLNIDSCSLFVGIMKIYISFNIFMIFMFLCIYANHTL